MTSSTLKSICLWSSRTDYVALKLWPVHFSLIFVYIVQLFQYCYICMAIKVGTELNTILSVWMPVTLVNSLKPDNICSFSVKYSKYEEQQIKIELCFGTVRTFFVRGSHILPAGVTRESACILTYGSSLLFQLIPVFPVISHPSPGTF